MVSSTFNLGENKLMTSKIYVVTHKPFKLTTKLKEKGYALITVGGTVKDNDGCTDADSRDNIAAKNPQYCELTAAYWIWKNVNAPIKGLCHYRRYFTHDAWKYNENKILSIEEAENILKDKDIILPERKYYNATAEELFLTCGYKKDLDITRKVIEKKCPEYLQDWYDLMSSNSGYLANMMICKSAVYDAYCEWLFDILFEVEKRTNLNGYSKAEARIYGYISERLLDVWIKHNKLKVKEFQSINPEKDFGLRFWLYRISMKLGKYKMIKTIMWKLKR